MADSIVEPLIPPQDSTGNESQDLDETRYDPEKSLRYPGIYIFLLTLSAGISGLLFGYDTGVISSTLVGIHSSLGHPLTTLDKSLITSMPALFALLISPASGPLADTYGRKKLILLTDFVFFLGSLIQALTTSVLGMIIGRAVVGLAIGAGSFVAPLYVTELSPTPFRGRLVIIYVLFITFGQVVAFFVGWAFVEMNDSVTGWRWIVGLGAVPAVVQCLVMFAMPDTPRWLVMKKRSNEARVVLIKVYGSGAKISDIVDPVLRGIEIEVTREEEAKRGFRQRSVKKSGTTHWLRYFKETWSELFGVTGNRRALIIACLLQGFQQLCGINSIMYFSATIFTLLGFESPTFVSLAVAITHFLLTSVALSLIDHIGRRRILLYSIPIMTLSLIICSLGFRFISLPKFLALPISASAASGVALKTTSYSQFAPIVVLVGIIIYVGAYALGLGPVPWLQSELFALPVRALGSSISTGTNWAANFLIGLTFLPMIQFLTPTFTFLIYAVLCVVGWLGIWRFYPETMGCGLEDVSALLSESVSG